MNHISRGAATLGIGLLATVGSAIDVIPAPAAPFAPVCQVGNMHLSIGQVTGGAGSLSYPIQFTNTGTHSCVLRGYPGVSILDLKHRQIGEPATRNPHSVPNVSVHAGQTVYATLRTNNRDVAMACRPTSAYIRVYPPASFRSTLIPYRLRICGSFEINPVLVTA